MGDSVGRRSARGKLYIQLIAVSDSGVLTGALTSLLAGAVAISHSAAGFARAGDLTTVLSTDFAMATDLATMVGSETDLARM